MLTVWTEESACTMYSYNLYIVQTVVFNRQLRYSKGLYKRPIANINIYSFLYVIKKVLVTLCQTDLSAIS